MVVFFTLTCALVGGGKLAASLRYMNGLWGSENTSLNSTAFTASLLTSTEAVSYTRLPPPTTRKVLNSAGSLSY